MRFCGGNIKADVAEKFKYTSKITKACQKPSKETIVLEKPALFKSKLLSGYITESHLLASDFTCRRPSWGRLFHSQGAHDLLLLRFERAFQRPDPIMAEHESGVEAGLYPEGGGHGKT